MLNQSWGGRKFLENLLKRAQETRFIDMLTLNLPALKKIKIEIKNHAY